MSTIAELETVGFLRWIWRQLTSMRIALILLLLLGAAAIPGSVIPQRAQNPMRVQEFFAKNAQLAQWMDRFKLFNVYASPWFSAIYLLLFISLVGCVLPRTFHHLKAIGAKPPMTPKYLDRMEFYRAIPVPLTQSDELLRITETWLKKKRFRILRSQLTISAEKGYLRESGNLLFHLSLILIIVGVGIGSLFGSKGEAILSVGEKFINTPTSYDDLNFGKFQSEGLLPAFSLRVTDFTATYDPATNAPTDYKLTVAAANPVGSKEERKIIKVNSPLTYGSTKIYLQANGYSPVISVRDINGKLVFEGAVPFLPQDGNLTSVGAIKIPDMSPQIGFIATFLPTADRSPTRGAFSSYPEVLDPRLLFSVWAGNLGMDSGIPQSVYRVNTLKMKQIGLAALTLNKSFNFGQGTITFLGWKSWVNLQIVDDPGKLFALLGAIFALLGLLLSLFGRQRRIWVRLTASGDESQVVELAGLAKNGLTGLKEEIDQLTKELVTKELATSNNRKRA
jgi:cytochrome c biogenesis protein